MPTVADTVDAAVARIEDGSTVLVGGFGTAGQPIALIDALRRRKLQGLTIVNNNAGNGDIGLAALLGSGAVTRIICSFPRQTDSHIFDAVYRSGRIELEVVPQGTLAERIRAGGAGIAGFYTRTSAGTSLAAGKESRFFDGTEYVLELPIRGDFALIQAHIGDEVGNLVYRKTARNFGPIMATAADHTIAEVSAIVAAGALDPEHIVTPGIYVDTLVQADNLVRAGIPEGMQP